MVSNNQDTSGSSGYADISATDSDGDLYQASTPHSNSLEVSPSKSLFFSFGFYTWNFFFKSLTLLQAIPRMFPTPKRVFSITVIQLQMSNRTQHRHIFRWTLIHLWIFLWSPSLIRLLTWLRLPTIWLRLRLPTIKCTLLTQRLWS